MKKLIFIGLIFIVGCTRHIVRDFVVSDTKYDFYKSHYRKSVNEGWSSYVTSIENKKYVPYKNPDFDKAWYQGMYGIFLAMKYRTQDKSLTDIKEYVKGIMFMLWKTGGIYLRDNTPETITEYKNGRTDLEASKDQMLGLITGMFMIHYYCNDKEVKDIIRVIVKMLDKQLNKHAYLLYNEREKRYYKGAYYLISHYYGVSRANAYILGKLDLFSFENAIEKAFIKITFDILKYKRRLIAKELYVKDINILDIPELKDKQWYKEMLQSDEFSVNLNFYELLIGATISKSTAKRVVNLLEDDEVMKLKHLNLASLYFYCINKWNLNDYLEEKFYKKVLDRDILWYPITIPPNSEKIGSHWTVDTVNGFIQRNFTLEFESEWNSPPMETSRTITDLETISQTKKVNIDCGVPFLMRYLLVNY